MKTADVLFVDFSTTVLDDIDPYLPEFQANKTAKDPAANIAEKRDAFLVDAPRTPHLARVDYIVVASARQQVYHELSESPAADFARLVREWYAGPGEATLFDEEGCFRHEVVRFVGFDSRSFVKMVGYEAAAAGVPLPTDLWYAAEHRDTLSMILPTEAAKKLNPAIAAKRLGLDAAFLDTAHLLLRNDAQGARVRLAWSAALTLRLAIYPHLDTLLHMLVTNVLVPQLIEEAAGVADGDVLARAGRQSAPDVGLPFGQLETPPTETAKKSKRRMAPPKREG